MKKEKFSITTLGATFPLGDTGGADRVAVIVEEQKNGWTDAVIELEWSIDGTVWQSLTTAVTFSASSRSVMAANVAGAAKLRLKVTTAQTGGTEVLATVTHRFFTGRPIKVAGAGDVVGPASATDNAVARFDTTTGKLIQNSGVTVDDSGNIATSGTVDGRDVSVDGTKLDTLIARSMFHAYDAGGGTTVTSTTWVDLPWDTAPLKGSDYGHSTSFNSQNITINTAGEYLVVADVSLELQTASAFTPCAVRIVLNGSPVGGSTRHEFSRDEPNDRDRASMSTRGYINASASDVVKIQIRNPVDTETWATFADSTAVTIDRIT